MANISHLPPTSTPAPAPQVQTLGTAPSAATSAVPSPPPAAAVVDDVENTPSPTPVDHHSPMHTVSQGEPPPPG